MNTLRLLVAALCLLCVKSETLTQPESLTVQPGHTLSISCTVSYSVSSYATHWIRQPAGKTMEWIGWKHTSGSRYKDSLKNQFSINVDSSSNTVTLTGQTMQPGDTAVYYCAKDNWGSGYFDYWGKGTQVTVTSASSKAPVVFPVMPCNADSGDTVTLACLATAFTPSTVKFSWTHKGAALTDFLEFPSVQQNELYSGVSQIRVKRQDWDERHPFKCRVDHAAGNKEVDFVKPVEIYELPSLKIMTTEENKKVTLSCLANNFMPNVYEFKWLKNNKEINDTSLQFTTPSRSQRNDNRTLYSAASFLSVPAQDLRDDTKLTCEFNLGRGQKRQMKNGTYMYRPSDQCTGTVVGSEDLQMIITPPSLEDMLYYREGTLRCKVKVKDIKKVRNVIWMNERRESLMNMSDNGAFVTDDSVELNLDITYDEWNRGIKRTCFLDHDDEPAGLQQEYVRMNDKASQKPPSVFMLSPLKHTRDNKVTLTCFMKDFYPKEIYVTWQIDDKDTTHEFNTTNSVRSNGSYSAYSHLTINMDEWEKPDTVYSCLVFHEAIDQNKNIVRSITQHTADQTTVVNLNMKVPDMCKA